jgi:hypothetical protein
VSVHRSNVGRLLHRLGLSHKKTLQASEQQRADIRERASCGSAYSSGEGRLAG